MSESRSISSIYSALKSQRAPWESWWEELRHYVLPSRLEHEGHVPDSSHRLYDTTAVEACQKLASAHMSYITPSHEMWFQWSSLDPDIGDEAESWYHQCSEIANRELAISNFYTELHECFLDRVSLGTGSLFCGPPKKGKLHFRHIPCGHFACSYQDDGMLDTYVREFSLSAKQAASMFGEKALGKKAKTLLSQPARALDSSLRFLHLVRLRSQRIRGRVGAKNMPYESISYCLDDDCVVEESGYNEFPYMVTRFLKWGEGAYGIAPARLVYPDIKQTQFLNRILDMLGEVAAFPRILELANQVGEVDLRAGGRTLINTESAALGFPREWATQGRYDVGMDRLKQKQESINRAFFLPMLELWQQNKQQMTAAEVYARENERVMLFSPSFTLFTTDFQPMMERIFATLFRLGRFPKPPSTLLKNNAKGEEEVEMPRAVYQGRIASVMRRIQSEGMERALARLQGMVGMDPQLVDHIDLDRSFRYAARMDGVPEEVLRPERGVTRMRRQREQAAKGASEASAASAINLIPSNPS